MFQLGVTTKATSMPSTMPIGSGNEGEFNGNNTTHFYPGVNQENVDTENNQTIDLESNTND